MSFLLMFGLLMVLLGLAGFTYVVAVNAITKDNHTPRHSAERPPAPVPRWYHPAPHWYRQDWQSEHRWRLWVSATTKTYVESVDRLVYRVERKARIAARKAELMAKRERRKALSNWGWLNASAEEVREVFGPCLP